MIHLDGAGTDENDKILIIGATNRPFELDEAVRRRLEKRLYIPLPSIEGRSQLMSHVIHQQKDDIKIDIKDEELVEISEKTKGYSGADLKSLLTEA